MEKRYYDAASVERVLQAFERGYGMTSADFYEAYLNDEESIRGIRGFHRQAWASFYVTSERLGRNGFAARVEKDLELA